MSIYAPPIVLKENPPVGDGCAHCHGPLRQADRNHAKADNGTRLSRTIWEGHLEADPFCSTECCRAWHGCPLTEIADGRDHGVCDDCGKALSPYRNRKAGTRCEACSDKRVRVTDQPGLCVGCACPVDETTAGCATCRDRKQSRARRARAKQTWQERRQEFETVAAPHLVEPDPQGSEAGGAEPAGAATTGSSHNSGEAEAPAAQRRAA